MDFSVQLVDEADLPPGQAWVIGITEDGRRFLFVKHGAFTPAVLEEAWRAGVLLHIPTQRRRREMPPALAHGWPSLAAAMRVVV